MAEQKEFGEILRLLADIRSSFIPSTFYVGKFASSSEFKTVITLLKRNGMSKQARSLEDQAHKISKSISVMDTVIYDTIKLSAHNKRVDMALKEKRKNGKKTTY